MDISPNKVVTAMNRTEGMFQIQAKAVILAMGCRERSRGALNIPGYRPAGIFSAGTAQRLVNMEGYMPGKEVVILGSGDIGLIMARRMTLEGAKVKVVAELMPYSGGLKRNIVQCLNDYGIPLKLSHTVVDVRGKERLEGITLAQVDEKGKPIPGTEEDYACDTLLLSVGLIPENELSLGMGVEMDRVTSGPIVNESLETNIPGVFACGNVLHFSRSHDLLFFMHHALIIVIYADITIFIYCANAKPHRQQLFHPIQIDLARHCIAHSVRSNDINICAAFRQLAFNISGCVCTCPASLF